ncbi:hypothetical protein [Enterococcus casseliflavus]|uniref:hypothetical protein n=1 Tax=Enterococcus casseliflavus TaxID=37734 RepID=UPI002DBDA8C4|nr:hypothetical protein [Enterococcus casseliflavus]MEB6146367.1 hypothetical protein [Enterococcus casseliflavus]
MNNLIFSDMEYIFIFDYYDTPLFFISQSRKNSNYYLFYSINDDAYFYSELSASDINYLFSNPNGYDVLHYLKKKSKLNFVVIKDNSFDVNSLAEYTNIFNEDIREALPLEKYPIEFDFVHKLEFEDIRKQYKSYFPNVYANDQLTLRIKNKEDSSSLGIDIVSSALEFMRSTWQDLSNRYAELGTEKKLLVSAPAKGSLKLDFKLEKDQQTGLFTNDASFSELIDFVNNLTYIPMYDEEELLNERKLIEETVKLYKVIEENDLSIDLISNKVKLGNIKKSEKIKRNLDVMLSNVNNQLMKKNVLTEEIEVEGEVLAANKSKNYFKIRSLAQGDISGTFERNLFKKVKTSEVQITISKSIHAHITKEQTTDIDTNETKIKYILNSFTQ